MAKKMIFTVEVEINEDQMDHVTASKPRTEIDWDDLTLGEDVGWIASGKVLCAREVGTEEEEQEKPGKNIMIVVEGGVVQAVGSDIPELGAIPLLNTEVLDRDDEECEEDDGQDTIDDRIKEMEANGLKWIY